MSAGTDDVVVVLPSAQRKTIVANATAFALADALAIYAPDLDLPDAITAPLARFVAARDALTQAEAS